MPTGFDIFRRIFCTLAGILSLALVAACTQAVATPPTYEAMLNTFVNDMAVKYQWDRKQLRTLLEQASYRQEIIDAMTKPAEAKPWHEYRAIFLTPERIRGGVEFWNANAATLERARVKYGVPPQIIVAIIGVETRYGANTGKHRVLDALTTLAFGYPPRSAFFRSELEQFLLLSREEALDPLGVKGSYAGALGKPQFIPSSYRRLAIDFDGDGRRNLWQSNADVIGSVANYFAQNHWKAGEAVTFQASGVTSAHQPLITSGRKPVPPASRLQQFQQEGIAKEQRFPGHTLVNLLSLEGELGPEYWLTLHNFYVITRYNQSPLYAMAAYQLSEEILRLRGRPVDGAAAH